MRTVPLAIAGVLAACGGPTIDGTSDESLEQSTAEVRESLPTAMRAQFDTALAVISLDGMDLGDLFAGSATTGAITSRIRERLEGLNADQVFALADSIEQVRLEEQLTQARQEIEELRALRDSAEQAEAYLAEFTVDRSRAYARSSRFSTDIIVELGVTNGLDVAISRAYFRGRLQSPGRSVPWMEETFNYSIPGGLEPGESATWRLQPNRFSGSWSEVEDAPADAVFTAEVYRLDGADGEPLMGGVGWDDDDEARLDALVTTVDSLNQAGSP